VTVLSTEVEVLDQLGVSFGVYALEVSLQSPPATDQLQQTTPSPEILLFFLQVCRKVANPLRKDGDLYGRGARVGFALAELAYEFACSFRCN
jgi:hypothetical protein